MNIQFSGSDAGGFRFRTSGAGGGEGSAPRRPRKAVGSPGKRIAVNALITLLVGAVYFYLELPPINLHAEEFYGFILLLCAAVVSLDEVDLATSLSATITSISNVGPGLSLAGPTRNFAFFSAASKLALSFTMLLGRLEIMPLLVLFLPSVWRRK